jgi:hypothetical protein
MNIFEHKTENDSEQKPVKVAQSTPEKNENFVTAMQGDFGARSVHHVDRPRYGHKV